MEKCSPDWPLHQWIHLVCPVPVLQLNPVICDRIMYKIVSTEYTLCSEWLLGKPYRQLMN